MLEDLSLILVASLWPTVSGPSLPGGGRNPLSPMIWNLLSQTHVRKFHQGVNILNQHVSWYPVSYYKVWILAEVAAMVTAYQRFLACLYQSR